MTIQELGSLGELIAAVATIATLAYLALQIRQSNRSHQLAAVARIGESTEAWLGQIIQDTTLLDVYIRALRQPETLSREERARFNILAIQFLRGTETGWLQVQWGVVDPSYWAGYRESIRQIVGSEAGRRVFASSRELLTRQFAAEVESILETSRSDDD